MKFIQCVLKCVIRKLLNNWRSKCLIMIKRDLPDAVMTTASAASLNMNFRWFTLTYAVMLMHKYLSFTINTKVTYNNL